MLVVAAGMQKSGSGWLFNLINALVASTGGVNSRSLSRGRFAARLLDGPNCLVGEVAWPKMVMLYTLSLRYGSFVVKTHDAPTAAIRRMCGDGRVRAIYSYRDLRDVALSAMDHGRRLRVEGRIGSMQSITTVEEALRFADGLVPTWRDWLSCPGTLALRFEDAVTDPEAAVRRIADHLETRLDSSGVRDLLQQFPPGTGNRDWSDGLHFNKGLVGRYQEELTPQEHQLAEQLLGPSLREMGYA